MFLRLVVVSWLVPPPAAPTQEGGHTPCALEEVPPPAAIATPSACCDQDDPATSLFRGPSSRFPVLNTLNRPTPSATRSVRSVQPSVGTSARARSNGVRANSSTQRNSASEIGATALLRCQ